jgi:Protein of unknown function (DUF2568)
MKVVNLALRFALELAALAAFAAWGLDATGGPARFVLAAATVGVAVTVWGRWVAPAARRRLADPARLAVEVAFFVAAGLALAATGRAILGAALAAAAAGNAALVRLLHHDLVETRLAARQAAGGRVRR